ncbi:hypothetical protein [uncultured Marinobacter sp.]|uniref:hypothetical protein n=1 Tax=uncultured Marinobacter sp. TaxID=187379 RepID=UPI0025D88326|nr:hypothetical protein [uncultured Marinobacter sp.]
MGMRGEIRNLQSRVSTSLVLAGLLAAAVSAGGAVAQSDRQDSAFQYEERSTINTIQLNSMEEETLANTVIEGGLTAPAAGVPLKPRIEDDFYLDPLGLRPGDSRTDLGRSQIPVEFRFSNPKSIPGQTHSNNYVIRPPENRTYDALNINMNER